MALVLTSVGGYEVSQYSASDWCKSRFESQQVLVAVDLFQTLTQENIHDLVWFGESKPFKMAKVSFVCWDENCPPKFAEAVREIMQTKGHQHG